MSLHRRSPRPLALALAGVRDGLAPHTVLADVQRNWRTAVGATIAAEAQPIAERGGIVTISCSGSVWAQELDLMAPAILKRLNALLEGASVTRLRCVSTPPQ